MARNRDAAGDGYRVVGRVAGPGCGLAGQVAGRRLCSGLVRGPVGIITSAHSRCSFIDSESPWTDYLGGVARVAEQNGGLRWRKWLPVCVGRMLFYSQAARGLSAWIGYWK